MIEVVELKRVGIFRGDDLYDQILAYIKDHPHSRRRDVIRDLNITSNQAAYRLFILTMNGLIDADTSELKKTTYAISQEVKSEDNDDD